MSLERKDVRFKLDPDRHEVLARIARAEDVEMGEWVEALVAAEVDRQLHRATIVAGTLPGPGKSGSGRE